MAEDLFEYGAVPKFIDFHNDENEHETSAFFKGDPILQATPRVKAQKNVILQNSSHINDQNIVPARKIDPIKNVLPAESVTSSQKADVPAENVAFSQIDPFAPALKATSNLALFNPSANRVAEKIRRRSQQIQAQPEDPPKESKSVRLRAREPSLIPRIRSSSIQRPASAAAKEKIQPTQRPASAAAKEKIQPTQPQQTIAFTRNLRSYKTP
uniref:TPX2 central domain-containing protein n=1 Tax=Panagrolaimus sp. ES5 TaxID=591445 RepID=A0AC34G626_9BILA